MSLRKTKDADIVFSKEDTLKDEDFLPSKIRHRISIMVPEDVLDHYRAEAEKIGIGYQTLMNQVLRKKMNGPEVEALTAGEFRQWKRKLEEAFFPMPARVDAGVAVKKRVAAKKKPASAKNKKSSTRKRA